MHGATDVLTLVDVAKRHRDGRRVVTVLDGVSLAVSPGEFLGLRGPRRAGKTTLLRIAAGLDRPDGGVVRQCGTDLARLSPRERARRLRAVGFVPQAQAWRAVRGRPIIDHIAMPLLIDGSTREVAFARAHAAAERVGARAYVTASSHELPPDALSRLALARALVRDPPLLLVDEPAVGDDHAARHALATLLLELRRDRPERALVVASRELAALGGADRIATVDGGLLRMSALAPAPVANVVALVAKEPAP